MGPGWTLHHSVQVVQLSADLVIKTHQQNVLKSFLRSKGEFLMHVHSSAFIESPNLTEFPRDARRVCSVKSKGLKTRPSWLSRWLQAEPRPMTLFMTLS
jgi:hypothetical protein